MILKFTFNFDILIFAKIYAEITLLTQKVTFLGQKLQKRISSPTTEVQIRIVQYSNPRCSRICYLAEKISN